MLSEQDFQQRVKAQISYFLTTYCLIIIGSLLARIPNVLNMDQIKSIYYCDYLGFTSETSEKLQYIVLTISFPLLYLFFNRIISRWKMKSDGKVLWSIFSSLFAVAILALIYYVNTCDPTFLQISIIMAKPLLFFILLPLCLFSIQSYQSLYPPIKKVTNILLHATPIIMILILCYLYINPTFQTNYYLAYHADAYYNPVLKISSGLTLGVDFNSLYGYYPYFYSAILFLMGNTNNLLHFSIIVASLLAVTLFCLYRAIYTFIQSRLIACLTFISVLFSLLIYSFISHASPYLQYVPHRVLFPAIFLYYFSIYIKTKNVKTKRLLRYVGFVIASLGILWNFDSGIMVFATQFLMLGYELLYCHKGPIKVLFYEILKIVLMACGSVVLSAIIINTITYIRSDQIIQLRDFLAAQLLFLGSGWGMIRMTLFHPWMLLVIVYSLALGKALTALLHRDKDNGTLNEKAIVLFVLPIFGIGLFSYYQGRSHDDLFVLTLYLGLVLLGIYVDSCYSVTAEPSSTALSQKSNYNLNALIATIMLCAIALTSIYYFVTSDGIWVYWNKDQLEDKSLTNTRIDVINQMSDNGKIKMDFLIQFDSLFYEDFTTPDNKPFPALVDLFTFADYDKIYDFMETTNQSIAIEKPVFDNLEKYKSERWSEIISRFAVVSNEGMDFCYISTSDQVEDYFFYYGKGTLGIEGTENNEWVWSSKDSQIVVYNLTPNDMPVNIVLSAATVSNEPYHLEIACAGKSQTYEIDTKGTRISQSIILSPGTNVIHFSTDAPRVDAPNDPREMYFRIVDFSVVPD